MPELKLIISNKPKRIFCATRESIPSEYSVPEFIRFPCYIEDFGTYWQIRVDGIVMYLTNLDGIALYKDILADLRQYGLGIKTLGEIDPWSLNSLDEFNFGDISFRTTDWLALDCGVAHIIRFETLGDYDPCTLGELDVCPVPGRTK